MMWEKGWWVVSGESGSVSQDSVDHWINESLSALLNGYELKDILNADETALFYSLMPDNSLNIRGEACTSGKKSRERRIVLLCCNVEGTETLALVIGKFVKPMCFKNISTLPCRYTNNSNAWMTANIFLNFFFVNLMPRWDHQTEKCCCLWISVMPIHQTQHFRKIQRLYFSLRIARADCYPLICV
jgi:hypothetical protein